MRCAVLVRVHNLVLPDARSEKERVFYVSASTGRRGRDQCIRTAWPGDLGDPVNVLSAMTPTTG